MDDIYFSILCSMIRDDYVPNPSRYRKVLWRMYSMEFIPIMHMDENRVSDALSFRERYFYDSSGTTKKFLEKPVNILELMVSLADRLETETMRGTVDRDRTADWFWYMMYSLGLTDMTDDVYDDAATAKILRRFLRRRYERNGKGGLFTISGTSSDMRKLEIWYQAALYLDEVLRREGFIDP